MSLYVGANLMTRESEIGSRRNKSCKMLSMWFVSSSVVICLVSHVEIRMTVPRIISR